MKVASAAVFEPQAVAYRRIEDGLKKAGLKVTAATEPQQLRNELLVVLGPGVKNSTKVAETVRQLSADRIILAAKTKWGPAPFADGILPLPISPLDLRARLPELGRARRASRETQNGILDPHTHFYTFAHFKEFLFVEVKRARRYGLPLAVAMVEFDRLPVKTQARFEAQLLKGLALAIRRTLRDIDLPVQFEPKRVLLVMPHTDLAGAMTVAQRICERVQRTSLNLQGQTFSPTVSVGVAASGLGQDLSFAELVRRAQACLKDALLLGGNRAEFFDSVARAKNEEWIAPKVG